MKPVTVIFLLFKVFIFQRNKDRTYTLGSSQHVGNKRKKICFFSEKIK